jgi:hypothetical protein
VRERTALTTNAFNVSGTNGDVSVVTVDGSLTVAGVVVNTGISGNILLQAGEAGEGTTANLSIGAQVSSANGSMSLLAADDVLMTNSGMVWTQSTGYRAAVLSSTTVNVTANAGTSVITSAVSLGSATIDVADNADTAALRT